MATVTKPVALDETLQSTNTALTAQTGKLNDIVTKLQLIATALGNPELIGDTDISGIADGTITGAIAEIDGDVTDLQEDMLTAQGNIDDMQDALSDDVVTVTNNPISITTLSAQYAQSTKINIEPIQSGSGDPSPSNIRPITGQSSANLIIKDSANVTVKTFTFAFGQTVFGGNLDVESGVLTVDAISVIPTACDVYASNDSIYYMVMRGISVSSKTNGYIFSSHFVSEHVFAVGNTYFATPTTLVAVPEDQTLDTKAKADAWLAANTPQFVYEIATPYTIQLTGAQVELLKGVNNITTDGASVTLAYRSGEVATLADVVKLDKKIDASGASSHVYSTNEHVVGTWIDGKPLYEKTFSYSGSNIVITPHSWTTVPFTDVIPNISYFFHTMETTDCSDTRIRFKYDGGYLKAAAYEDLNVSHLVVTIRYTKTTD